MSKFNDDFERNDNEKIEDNNEDIKMNQKSVNNGDSEKIEVEEDNLNGYNTNEEVVIEHVQDKKFQEKKPKKKGSRKVLIIIVGGLICAMVGGVIGALSITPFINKNNKIQTPPVYNNTNNTPHFSNSEGALSIPEIVEKVAPSVVGVSTKSLVKDKFFNNFKEQEGIGSGFIINEEGYVVTNFHVIRGAQEVKVIFNNEKEVNAKVVNYDQQNDIAVLKISDDVKMPGVAVLGDSSAVKPGEDVIAIGNPLGKEFSSTVTRGIVSSPNRKLKTEEGNIVEYIQTDAAINPGNSGGPLINSKGEVIGINTAKKVGPEIEGIGFAIPINLVKSRLGALSKPLLRIGIAGQNINEEVAKANNVQQGVYVANVQEFSPAEKAGLRIGDIIIKFGGERVKTIEELNTLKEKYSDGDVVKITCLRDGKEITLDLKLIA